MQFALLAARLLLSVVFAVAGLAKLADRAGSRRALIDFGVPSTLASPLGVLLPLAELVVAAALLPVASAWYGALGALSLLLLFVVGIALKSARGRTPDCHCFGQLSSAPAGWATLARNAALAVVSISIVWHGRDNPGLSIVSWIGDLTLVQRMLFGMGLVGLILLAAEGWVLLQMLRQQGRLLLRLDAMETRLTSADLVPALTEGQDVAAAGLTIGASAPTFRLKGLRGEMVTLEALLKASKPVLLFFTNPSCGPCQVLMPDVSRWQREYSSALTIVVISEGTVRDNRSKSAEYGVAKVLLQQKREVAEAYQAHGTPCAVLIQTDGKIGSALAMGADPITALVNRTIGSQRLIAAVPERAPVPQSLAKQPLKIGEKPPRLRLSDLKGQSIDFGNSEGKSTLLLFWNPACGFCSAMLDDLRTWEASRRPDAPRLLVVSDGSIQENVSMGLRSQIVLDQHFSVGQLFGATGTPSAVLLNSEGTVASGVAAGGPDVMALANNSAVRYA